MGKAHKGFLRTLFVIIYSKHWIRKQAYRPDITDDLIEFALINSVRIRDKQWIDVYNAICRISPSGRLLKVVYRQVGLATFKIITAYWMD